MRMRVLSPAVCFLACSILFAATPGSGRYLGVAKAGEAAQPIQPGLTNTPNDFGPAGDTVSTFIAQVFRPVDSGITFTSFLAAMWPTILVTPTSPDGVSGPVFMANLQVPEGAVID